MERTASVVMVRDPMMRRRARSRYRGLSKVIADRLHGQSADRPERKSKERHHPERAPAPRVERFLRQARRDKAGDIDLLPIGVGARLVEAMQGMLIGGFGKPALAVQLLVGAELARQRIGSAPLGGR